MRFLLFLALLGPLALPAQNEVPVSPPAKAEPEKQVPPLALRKLIDSAVLMLEARAYEQFIRAFVAESDRGKFERAYTREGSVDYPLWGQEKGVRLLAILRKLGGAEAVVNTGRVCFFEPGEEKPVLSFVAVRSMWLIENSSRCGDRKASRPAPAVKEVGP